MRPWWQRLLDELAALERDWYTVPAWTLYRQTWTISGVTIDVEDGKVVAWR